MVNQKEPYTSTSTSFSIIVPRSELTSTYIFDFLSISSIKMVSRVLWACVGQPVTIISSHGAVDSVRCCGVSHLRLPSLESTLNLQSTFSPPQRWSSRRSRGQQPETSPTSSSTTSNCCTTQGQCSQLYFSLERKSYLTFSPCDSLGRNLDQFTTVLSSNI